MSMIKLCLQHRWKILKHLKLTTLTSFWINELDLTCISLHYDGEIVRVYEERLRTYGLVPYRHVTQGLYFACATAYFISAVCQRQWEGGWCIPPSITVHLDRSASAANTRGVIVTVCAVILLCCPLRAIHFKDSCSKFPEWSHLWDPTWFHDWSTQSNLHCC